MKLLSIFALFIASTACGANTSQPGGACSSELLGGDTVMFQVDADELTRESLRLRRNDNNDGINPMMSARQTRDAIERWVTMHTSFGMVCDVRNDLAIRVDPNGCRLVKSYSPFSEVCYLESRIGYFISHLNYFGQYSVTFVRWD
jgi:hypothetical protein